MRAFFLVACAFTYLHITAQEQFSVYFNSDSFELTAPEAAKLEAWLAENSTCKIVGIHGFTDEDGTSSYNDTLAQRRIGYVVRLLKNRIAFRDDFKARSFGELHQLSKAKAENRKVTLFYLQAKDLMREDEILKIPTKNIPAIKKKRNYPEKFAVKNPDGSTSVYKLDKNFMIAVDQAKPGEKLKIDNLNFQINTFAIVPESRGKLYELLIVLQDNPNLKIDIQGHLCCMPNDRLDLSTQRAKAVYNFLVANGISKSRLSYQGFGSTQPIYSIPEKDELQRAANRRVEVMIIYNE